MILYWHARHTKNWTIHIQKEWKILEKNLPDSIFVRVYESQMDVMRVAIIGAKGTPYHDGLFFFDLYFPNKFPDVPPKLYFHNRYRFLSLNPNFEPNGIVRLSLLNNTKNRYTTEVGGPINGESSSWRYSEEVFIGSLWTLIHIIRRPPKDFEDLVKEHFRNRSHDIISACEAYMEGARVGSLGENESQEVDLDYKYHQKLFFEQFKNSLREPMEKLFEEFTRIWDMY
ncbi:ubiquitin-conjugating enzyme, variant 2 [Trifolium repens]|nr:ubiquitin-conjugating enzyme, variant 2 [Trifolium repens]